MQKYNIYVIIEALCNADLHGVERKTYLKIIGLNVKRERIKKGVLSNGIGLPLWQRSAFYQ